MKKQIPRAQTALRDDMNDRLVARSGHGNAVPLQGRSMSR